MIVADHNVSDIWIVDNGTDKVYQYFAAAGPVARTSLFCSRNSRPDTSDHDNGALSPSLADGPGDRGEVAVRAGIRIPERTHRASLRNEANGTLESRG
jgi:hypothetical protein